MASQVHLDKFQEICECCDCVQFHIQGCQASEVSGPSGPVINNFRWPRPNLGGPKQINHKQPW